MTGASDPLFAGGGQLGRVMAGWDWASTPLGPSRAWPASLRSAVRILLTSRFSMWLGWGPELRFFYNDAYQRDTLRAKHPWGLGRPTREVWAEIWDDVGPRLESVMASGVATWDEDLLLFLERSGYPEETYHTFSYSPLVGDDAAVAGILCVVTEGTDRVLSERRMATLRDLATELADTRTEDAVFTAVREQVGRNGQDLPFTLAYLLDGDHVARLACTTGISAGHPAAPPVIDLTARETAWPVYHLLAGNNVVIEDLATRFEQLPVGDWTQPPTHAVGVPLAQQGQQRPTGFFIAALNPYRTFDDRYRGFVDLLAGQIASALASARAYEAERKRAAALAELDRAKTEFFSNVSHEFRTPLTLIAGPAQDGLADEAQPLPPAQRRRMELIHRNAGRLRRLVNDLLDVSRIEGGRLAAETVATDLAVLTRDIATSFAPAVQRAGLRFDVDCPALDRTAYVDPGLWEKIVLNLLSNAVKFTAEGTVRLSLRGGPELVELTVEDTGAGIAQDQIPLVFQRFHRVAGMVGRSHEGTGIGLALVHELARLHGGEVSLHSKVGAGSTFIVRIPYGTTASATGVPAAQRASSAWVYMEEALRWSGDDRSATAGLAPPGQASVLVVDDNPDLRRYIAELLAPFWRVVLAHDGRQALAMIRDQVPDLVLTDVMMPNLDGFGLLSALRENPDTATIPVIFLSARAGEESAIEGLESGADDYLVKPFSAAELQARVRSTLELAALRNNDATWRKALVESMRDAIVVTGSAGTILDANAAFEDILGYDRTIRYQSPYPWWPDPETEPEMFHQATERLAALLRGESVRYAVPFRHRDGHQVFVEGWATSIFDGDQRRVISVFRDVTAELAVAQRQQALSSFGIRLAEASDVHEVRQAALAELGAVFGAHSVLLIIEQAGQFTVMSAPEGVSWESLDAELRSVLHQLRKEPSSPAVLVPGGADGPGPTRIRGIGAAVPSDGPSFLGLWLDLDPPREFSAEDRALFTLLCGYFSQALARAELFDDQRAVARALQQSILGPTETPDNVAVRYVPSVAPLEVGGDWYDVVHLPGGWLGLVVGDCVGQGLTAATIMGQLRSACRALLLELSGPSEVLHALDRFAAHIPGACCTTVFCAVVSLDDGVLRYSCAGHLPGVLVHPDGQTELLDDASAVPLAVLDETHRPEAETTLRPGSTLLLYTDGLIEQRQESLDVGLDRLRTVLTEANPLSEEHLADHLLERLLPDGHRDDVAIVIYRHPSAEG